MRKDEDILIRRPFGGSLYSYLSLLCTPTLTHQIVQHTNQHCSGSYGHTMYLATFFGQCLFISKFPVKEELQQKMQQGLKEPSFKIGVRVHKNVQYPR